VARWPVSQLPEDGQLGKGERISHMDWIVGSWPQLATVAGKAALMYAVAVFGLRTGQRRTIAQWTITDFVTAVAIGAVVGRTSVASSESFVTGAVALLTLIVMHRLASTLRLHPALHRVFDHQVRVLVAHGELRRDQLRRCGLTENDVFSHLREKGVFDVADVEYLLYEAEGALTIVGRDRGDRAPLVEAALQRAVGVESGTPGILE
jgi:uncharacterized membrane protein YcaP (DUF421 family)